jgi:F0F1-type ATP synthase assembly protein I
MPAVPASLVATLSDSAASGVAWALVAGVVVGAVLGFASWLRG